MVITVRRKLRFGEEDGGISESFGSRDHLQGWAPDSTWLQSLMQKPCFALNLRYRDSAVLRFQTAVGNLSVFFLGGVNVAAPYGHNVTPYVLYNGIFIFYIFNKINKNSAHYLNSFIIFID